MKFSTRTTYGLRAMINLAQNWGKGRVSLPAISKTESISEKYLERLFSKLKAANLIIAKKGVKGGYYLAKSPDKIAVYDIIKVLEGSISPFYCLGEDGRVRCGTKHKCGAAIVLLKVQQAINLTLRKIKLKDLL